MAIPLRSKLIILTAVLASLLEIIDTAIVNVAVPTMMGNLGATLDEISWVITGYIIANAIVLPIAGWMSQQLGRKFYYTSCIVLFTVASAACGLAPNLTSLIIFRVIQGFAGGALLPTSQALIYEAFPPAQAGMASAIYGMSVMIGPTIGPTLGGYLTDTFGWRSIFNINLPIGLACCILSYLLVEDIGSNTHEDNVKLRVKTTTEVTPVKPRVRVPIDYWGLALLIIGIGSLQYVLERGNADDWFQSTTITLTTITAILSLVGLIWWELRAPYPILELRHFKVINFRNGVWLMAGLGAILYGILFLVPVFVNRVQGLTATQTGMLFIPGAFAGALMMPLIGSQLRKRDPRTLIFIGTFGLSTALLMMSQFNSLTSEAGMFWPLFLRGIAMSFLFVPINTSVLMEFSGVSVGQAAGMLNLFRQLGGSFSIAILSTLFQHYQVHALAHLSAHLTWFDPAMLSAQHDLMAGMKQRLSSTLGLGSGSIEAAKVLYFHAKKEAFVLAFDKVLLVALSIFALTLIPLVNMRKPTKLGVVSDVH